MRFLTEEDRQQRIHELMTQVHALKGRSAKEPNVHELHPHSLKVLIKAALEPAHFLLAIYIALGLHPGEGKRAIEDLRARGFVKLHRIPRKGRGAQPQVVEVLPPGRDELEKRGITPAERKLRRGGFLHDIYARYIYDWARSHGYLFSLERQLGNKFFDLVYEDSGRELHGVEICLTGSPEWTAQQTLKGAAVQGISTVVVACEDKKFLKAVMDKVKEIDGLGLYQKKIVGTLLSEYLP